MATESTKPIILVVDDTEDIRELVQTVLQDTYTIRPASDGRTALKRALEKPTPDLILLDVDMPGASGHDVCRALKITAATAEIPIIFLTAKDEPADVVKGFQLGAADYIIKPLNAEVLRARVRNHIELSYRRRQQEALVRDAPPNSKPRACNWCAASRAPWSITKAPLSVTAWYAWV